MSYTIFKFRQNFTFAHNANVSRMDIGSLRGISSNFAGNLKFLDFKHIFPYYFKAVKSSVLEMR